MTLNIINRNYIFRHKYFVFVKLIAALYVFLLLRHNSSSSIFLQEYEHEFEVVSELFLVLTGILFFLNGFLHSKYGQIIMEPESITILKNGWEKKIELAEIKSIRIEKLRGNEFLLKLDKFQLDLEISPTELEKFKKLETVTPINFGNPTITDRIKSRLQIFSKNKDFMDEPYRK